MENSKKKITWSEEMDVVLLKEVILYEPYQYKMRTKESGNAWKAIADTLSNCQPIFTHVWLDPRSCRERFNLMKTKKRNGIKTRREGVWDIARGY